MLFVPFVPLLCFPALGFLFALPAEYNNTTSPPPARSASPTHQVRNAIQAEGNTYILGGIFVCFFLSFFFLNKALKRESRHQTDMKTSRFSRQIGGGGLPLLGLFVCAGGGEMLKSNLKDVFNMPAVCAGSCYCVLACVRVKVDA